MIRQLNLKSSNATRAAVSPIAAGEKTRKRGLKAWLVYEGKLFFAMFIYLFILFGLLNLHEYIVLAQHKIEFTKYGYGLINAWIFARILIVAENLHLGRSLEDRPLIYLILLKACLFMIVVVIVRCLEAVLVGLWNGRSLSESIHVIGGGGLEGIASVALTAAFAMIPFFAYREVARVMGDDEVRALIFRSRASTRVPHPKAPG